MTASEVIVDTISSCTTTGPVTTPLSASPQTNGICERFHKTVLDEFYRIAFRKKLYHSLAGLQADLDQWLRQYNEVRTHQGQTRLLPAGQDQPTPTDRRRRSRPPSFTI